MIRALLLCLACSGVIDFSRASYDFPLEIPACENKKPDDIYMDLSDMDLKSIRKPIASSSTITCLNLAGNQIVTITPNAFDGFPELYYLNLKGNPISISDFTQTKISKLKTLIIDGPLNLPPVQVTISHPTYIPYIREPIKEPIIPPLFSDSDDQNEAKSAICLLPALEKISLRNYQPDGVRDWLRILHLPNLTHLYLSDSNCANEHLDDFLYDSKNTKKLTHVYMDGNKIVNFRSANLANVRYLSLNRNKIKSLGGNYWGNLEMSDMYNLEYLSLIGNEISNVVTGDFDSPTNLQYLNLADNRIDDFPLNEIGYMVNLKNLILDNNLLTSVPSICKLKQLYSLSLSGNRISSINKISFCELPQLSSIYLKNNGLSQIADETFGHLPALRMIDLSSNNIVSLPKYWMAPRNFIPEIHLDANQFADIDSMSLSRADGLQLLSVGHNPMKIITVLSLMNLPNSTSIDVSRDAYNLTPP